MFYHKKTMPVEERVRPWFGCPRTLTQTSRRPSQRSSIRHPACQLPWPCTVRPPFSALYLACKADGGLSPFFLRSATKLFPSSSTSGVPSRKPALTLHGPLCPPSLYKSRSSAGLRPSKTGMQNPTPAAPGSLLEMQITAW